MYPGWYREGGVPGVYRARVVPPGYTAALPVTTLLSSSLLAGCTLQGGGVLGSGCFPGLGEPPLPAPGPGLVKKKGGIAGSREAGKRAESGNNQIAPGQTPA